MANEQSRPVGLDPFALPRTRARAVDVPMAETGAGSSAIADISARLAARFGQMADGAAQAEGARAGAVAGLDPDFRPGRAGTIRGNASDAAGTDVYVSNLMAKVDTDMATLSRTYEADPAGFAAAATKLREETLRSHAFEEAIPEVNRRFNALQTSYGQRIIGNFEQGRRDTDRATLLDNLSKSQTARQRLLVAGGDGADTEAQVRASIADDAARVDALVKTGALTAEQAQRLKLDNRNDALQQMILARAGTLATPADIAAFRDKARKDFAEGKIEGLDGEAFAQVDAALTRLVESGQVKSREAANRFRGALKDYTERLGKGLTPSDAEWIKLNEEGARLGGEGAALLDEARQRAMIARTLATLPPDEAQAWLKRYEEAARAGSVDAVDRIIGVESGGRADAANPRSTAVGLGQFIASTWLDVIKRNAPEIADGKSDAELLALRTDPDISRAMTAAYAAENGAGLEAAGFAATPATTYLAHFAGLAGAKAVLGAPDASAAETMAAASGGRSSAADIIKANPFLAGMTGRDLAAWAERKMGRGGMAAGTADRIEFARGLVEARQRAWKEDPLNAAADEGLIGPPAPLPIGDAALGAALGQRIAQADAVAATRGGEVKYLRPEEKAELARVLGEGGAPAMATLETLVKGAGSNAPKVLRELGEDAPALAQAGAVLASGGSGLAVRDALEALKLKRDGAKLPALPKTLMTLTGEVMGDALSGNLDEKTRVQKLAEKIYQTRAFRDGLEPDSEEASDLWRRALQEAAGARFEGDAQIGGFIDYGGGWSGLPSGTVALPPGMRADAFPTMIGAIRDEDLAALPVPPQDESGNPMTAADVRAALPVRHGDGFRFAVEDPQTGERLFLRGADGRPFVLSARQLRDIASVRAIVGDIP